MIAFLFITIFFATVIGIQELVYKIKRLNMEREFRKQDELYQARLEEIRQNRYVRY